jgi:hypothetical protein
VRQIKPGKQNSREWLRPLGFLFTVGWYVAFSVIIPTGIGYWLDLPDQFNKKPLFTLIGFGFGTIIAFYGLYRMLRRFYVEQKELEKKKETNNN